MPSRFNRAKPLIVLSSIIVCASCTPLQTSRSCQCSLPCDEAPQMKPHNSVHVFWQHFSEKQDKIHNVSSLYNEGRCAVPGCFQRDALYTLRIYTNDGDAVPKMLFEKADLHPECDPEGVSGKNPNDANGKLSNKLLILLAFCFLLFCHLEEPR